MSNNLAKFSNSRQIRKSTVTHTYTYILEYYRIIHSRRVSKYTKKQQSHNKPYIFENSRILEFLEVLELCELLFSHSVWGKHMFPYSRISRVSRSSRILEDLGPWAKAFGVLGNGLWGPGQGPQGFWARAFRGHERKRGR